MRLWSQGFFTKPLYNYLSENFLIKQFLYQEPRQKPDINIRQWQDLAWEQAGNSGSSAGGFVITKVKTIQDKFGSLSLHAQPSLEEVLAY